MKYNVITDADLYKFSMPFQYEKGTTQVSSYLGPRIDDGEICVFGMQTLVKNLAENPVTKIDIEEAEDIVRGTGMPFYREGWDYILNKHGGNLPVEIESLPEGTILYGKSVSGQIHITDEKCWWLTTPLETSALRSVWYPSSVASLSRAAKKVLREFLLETSDDLSGLDYMLHDFGARGVSSRESSALGGMAHLVYFKGSDTTEAIRFARHYYNCLRPAFSVPASEHSTMTSWGRSREAQAYSNMIDQFSTPGSVYSVVTDSYDQESAIENIWGRELLQKVVQSGGRLVVRLDSGDPLVTVPNAIKCLMKYYGAKVNSKGYRVLPSCIRVLQGDGINLLSMKNILRNLKAEGLSAENVVFGMGGALLQDHMRDDQAWAMKASSVIVNGEEREVGKDPKGDASKKSFLGVQAVIEEEGKLVNIRKKDLNGRENKLVPVFRNGVVLLEWTLDEIRERAAA